MMPEGNGRDQCDHPDHEGRQNAKYFEQGQHGDTPEIGSDQRRHGRQDDDKQPDFKQWRVPQPSHQP